MRVTSKYFPLNLPQHSIHEHGGDKFTSTKRLASDNSTSLHDVQGGHNENEIHVHTTDREKNMRNWSESLKFQDLPSIEPLQEANIIMSLKVSIHKSLISI